MGNKFSKAKSPPKPVFHYLEGIKARGEGPRVMMAYKKVDMEVKLYDFQDKWPQAKRNHEFPFDQLPALTVGDKTIAQTGSIMRYLALIYGLVPSDPLEAAKQDSIFCLVEEMSSKVHPTYNRVADDFEASKNEVLSMFEARKKYFEEQLGTKDFFGGPKPSYADFGCFHILSDIQSLDSSAFNEAPKLKAWLERVAKLDGVKEYLANQQST